MEEEQIGINGYAFLFTPKIKYDRQIDVHDVLHCVSDMNIYIIKINKDGFFRVFTDTASDFITRDQMEGEWVHWRDMLKEMGWKTYKNGKLIN